MFSFVLAHLQNYGNSSFDGAEEGVFAALGVMLLVYLAFVIFMIITMWKLFTKANKPGWAALVPIYNLIVLLEIVGRPVWWIILMLIPCANIVIAIMLCFDIAKAYGKDTGFGVGILLLSFIFLPILAFSKDIKYVGPAAAPPINPYQQPPQG